MADPKDEFFANLLRMRLPMAPDPQPTAIRDADEQIDEATKRLASIDRGLAALQHQSRRRPTKQLQVQIDAVRRRRDRARIELLEIVELAEMPVVFMGSA